MDCNVCDPWPHIPVEALTLHTTVSEDEAFGRVLDRVTVYSYDGTNALGSHTRRKSLCLT